MNEKLLKDLESQLKIKDFKLNSLLEITNAINTNQPVDQIIRIFEFIVKEQLGFDKFILFNKQEDWNCLIKTGFKVKETFINAFLQNNLLKNYCVPFYLALNNI